MERRVSVELTETPIVTLLTSPDDGSEHQFSAAPNNWWSNAISAEFASTEQRVYGSQPAAP